MARPAIAYALLAAAVLIAFGMSLGASFHYDDHALFGDPSVTSPGGWPEIWRLEQTRPLTYLTFWFNHTLGGRDPAGYHLLSLLIHLASVLLLYNVLGKLVPGLPAFAGAALFAIHPIQTEPVVYIYARATLLMTLFCLLALREWLKGRHWLAVPLFALAMLSKEECAAFPLFLLLLHFSISRNRKELPPIGAMLAIALAIGLRVVWVLAQTPDSGAGTGAAISVKDYFLTQGTVIWRYAAMLFLPRGFTVDHDVAITGSAFGLLAWGGIAVVAVLCLYRFPRAQAGFWVLGGLLLLLPSSSIFPADDLMVERRLYLPLVAFGPAAGLALTRLTHQRRWVRAAAALASAALLAITVGRVQVWQTEQTLWAEAVERSPQKLRPRLQLARASDTAAALQILAEARTIAPDDPRVASQMGTRYVEAGRPAEALAEFGRALALSPGSALAHNNRGVALLQLGQAAVSRADFERALEIDPCLFNARLNLLRLGVPTEAPDSCRYTPEQQAALQRGH